MQAADVLEVVGLLAGRGIVARLDGGWGVDALLGEQNREHDDLDVTLDINRLDDVIEALSTLGYAVDLDLRPTRVTLVDVSGRQVDVHLLHFDDDGNGWQVEALPDGGDGLYGAGHFAFGRIAGRRVECIDAELQILHHVGYEPRLHDRHDVDLLCEHFAVSRPAEYRRGESPGRS